MLMSQAAISASVIGFPRPGPSADAALAAKQSASPRTPTPNVAEILLGVNMLDLPGAVDAPAGDSVKMVVQHRADRRGCRQLPALRDEFGAGGLPVAGIVR